MTNPPRDEPSTGPIIRRAGRRDLPRIGELGALLVDAHYGFDSRRFLPATGRTKEAYASFLGAQLGEPEAAVFVAADDSGVIGYAYAVVDESYDYMALRGPAGILHDIIVDPEHRGRGVGKLLLAEVLKYLQSQGAPRVLLSTAERNEAAQRLFAALGFRRTMIEMTRELP